MSTELRERKFPVEKKQDILEACTIHRFVTPMGNTIYEWNSRGLQNESQEINISRARSAIETECLLHTGSHILRLGSRSRTIEYAETREQGIRKRNHPSWEWKIRDSRLWDIRDECMSPLIVVTWVSLPSAILFNSTVLWEVIYCYVIWESNWFGLDFMHRRRGGRVQSPGPFMACYDFPAAPVISVPTAWRGLAPSWHPIAINWRKVFFNVPMRRICENCQDDMILFATLNNWSGHAWESVTRSNANLRKMVASSWPLRSQPLDRIS